MPEKVIAPHLLEDGYDIRAMRELLGREDVKIAMIHTHVLNNGCCGVVSPALVVMPVATLGET